MKIKFAVAILASVLLLMTGTSLAQDPGAEAKPAEKAEWTLMFYMDSDNNLEAPQILINIQELLEYGSTDKVNIVMLVDRNPKGDDEKGYTNKGIGGLPNWTDARYLYVEKGKLRQLGDWGELNMGDPANLVRFVTTASEQFPAKKYGLIFGDHGAGWQGILGDETSGGDNLNMVELYQGLQASTKNIGKLDLIGFDACLMGNLEAARVVSPFAKTMVASEEVEPGLGWFYAGIMTVLSQKPEMDGAYLGKVIVAAYKSRYTRPDLANMGQGVTLAAIDLSKIDPLVTAVSDLSAKNDVYIKAGGRPALIKTAKARSQTEEYGKSGGKSEFCFFDLVNYAQNIKTQTKDPELGKAADAVVAATNAAVISKMNGPGMPHSSGLSIWFPTSKEDVDGAQYKEFTELLKVKWGSFLSDYTSLIVQDKQAPEIEDVQSTDAEMAKTDVTTVTAKVNADDIDEATFVLAEQGKDETIIIGAVPAEPDEKGILKEEWDGEWFAIGDGTKQVICPVTDFRELADTKDAYWIEVPAQVRFKGKTAWRDVTLYFVVDFQEKNPVGKFVYAFDYSNKQAREVDIDAGDSVRPVYISVDSKGNTAPVAATDEADILHIGKADDLEVGRERVAPGKYLIGFTVTDLSGNSNDKFVDVKID